MVATKYLVILVVAANYMRHCLAQSQKCDRSQINLIMLACKVPHPHCILFHISLQVDKLTASLRTNLATGMEVTVFFQKKRVAFKGVG